MTANEAQDLIATKLAGKLASITRRNGTCFTVRGFVFAIVRNGMDSWDLLTAQGIQEALPLDRLADAIRESVEESEEDNAGWHGTGDLWGEY